MFNWLDLGYMSIPVIGRQGNSIRIFWDAFPTGEGEPFVPRGKKGTVGLADSS